MEELRQRILEACAVEPPPRRKDLEALLEVDASQMEEALEELIREGWLLCTRKGRYCLPSALGLYRGKISGNARGFAFFVPEDGSQDMFVPHADAALALHGDVVLARRASERGRPVARVHSILKRANALVLGTYRQDKHGGSVIPQEEKIPVRFRVGSKRLMGARDGEKVVLRVTRWPEREDEQPYGRIEEVLGPGGYAQTDLRLVMRKHGLREAFPQEALEAARETPQEVGLQDLQGRKDYRDQPCFTIDGADAKDFDDALYAQEIGKGIRLYVHIADVSHYVPLGGPLDREAYERGTSVYLIDDVLPMLPEALSNGICSLNPGVDRLAFTCVMDVDRSSGDVMSYRLESSVIRSSARLIYEEVTELLEGDELQAQRMAAQAETLRLLAALHEILHARRVARGAVDFDLDEAQITLDEQGVPLEIAVKERGIANSIVEECMLLANETVASYAVGLELPFLYRVHESPGQEKIQELADFAAAVGCRLRVGKKGVFPSDLQDLLRQAKGRPEEGVLSRLTLRAMQRARYAPSNLGHFGLALEDYCHFTSPIRRYPDLFIHRALKLALGGDMDAQTRERMAGRAQEAAVQSSERERAAMEAEREWDDMKKAQYMLGRLGEEFEGVISSVSSFGFFVELPNTVQGLVPLRTLNEDDYEFDEKQYALLGRRTKKSFRIGDGVRVLCAAANPTAGRVDFELV